MERRRTRSETTRTVVSRGLSILLIGCVLAAVPAASQQPRSIRIATEGAFPPFNYLDDKNEPHGFEIDLAKALCEAMAARCSLVLHEWEGIIKGLLAKEYDAIMASLAISPKRRERIAFSKRYYLIPPAFIGARASDLRAVTPAALTGKVIGTTEGSQHAAYLQAHYKSAEIKLYGKLDEANLDLMAGRVELVLGDKLALWRFVKSREGSCCRFIGDPPVDVAFYGEGVGVGLRKEDRELKAMFDRAIDRVMTDGTYDRIQAKYFEFSTR
jgi:polar amino acid transport system substrate-binding protein